MTGFNDLTYMFQQFGVLDFLLPFLLVYVISFAVLQKSKVLGDEKTGRKYHAIVALVLAMSFVVPHVMGLYPLGYDPVAVMNESLPSISLVAIAAIMLLLLLGIFGASFTAAAAPVVALASIAFVIYIFGAALKIWGGPWDVFSWWTADTTELMIVLLVFGAIVYFITAEPKQANAVGSAGKIWNEIKTMFKMP